MADIAALAPLVGRWATTITLLHPPEAWGRVHHAVDSYRWLPGDQILVHEVEARMGEDTVHSLEVYWTDGQRILARNFDGRGQVSDYRAVMEDGAWRVDGETERFASTRLEPDVIEGLWRLKDGEGWVDWMTVRLDRVA